MNRDELQRLRDLPIEEVAERLGLEVRRHKALCPFHQDRHPSLSFHTGRNTYRCFVCDAKGGTIDLTMNLLHKDFLDACDWLGGQRSTVNGPRSTVQGSTVQGSRAPQDWNQGVRPLDSSETNPSESTLDSKSSQTFDAARYEQYFQRPWLSEAAQRFLFEERRLDPRVVRWCRLTTWRDHHGTEWLQIPYYDQQRRLVGIQNRNLSGSEPRFRFPQGSQCTVYNRPVLPLLKEGEPLWITEGCSDCWAMLSAGRKAVAIPSATLLKPQDVEVLHALHQTLHTEFHMTPDRDEPGERLFLQLKELLPNLVHHQLPLGCKDYGDEFSMRMLR